jgi:putative solute:sodium symporter small subunit
LPLIQIIAKGELCCYPFTQSIMNEDQQTESVVKAAKKAYWTANISVVLVLMGIWFLFGCVLSIFAVDALNKVRLGGFPLGFWMAQQGTTIAFIFVILAYVLIMKRLDMRYLAQCGKKPSEEPASDA